jgi:SRSO17 transposase
MMTLGQIASLGKELTKYLALFVGRFRSQPGFALGRVYIQGLLSDVGRKNVEASAMEFDTPPRTLQRFLESVKWDESGVRDQCQQLVACEHAHAEAIGCIDESGTAKSGVETVGAGRQWLGSRGKVDNGVVGVHLSYCAPGFQCLLDSELYLPEDWADDPTRRKKTTCRTMWCSAPSRRSPWDWSITRWPTACVSRPGRSTNCTDATRPSWMASNSVGRYSWLKCRRISTAV